MSQTPLEKLIADDRFNAVLSWLLVVAIALIGLSEFVTGGLLWTTFAAALVVLVVLPPLAVRSWLAMLPWEVLVLAALPVLGMALEFDRLTGDFVSYLSVAAIALVVAVELQTFTTVRMIPSFAVVFVAVTTMAAAALWALFRWSAAGFLGVPFPSDHDAVMWEFVYSAVAGLGAGVVFELYFRRLGRSEPYRPADGASIAESDDA
ncbi:hypothetical protein [Natronorubrum aibiense]|uniref:Uncharacterized protein n=1 Tax=Natronorubrum aibiense TaxID=348826 RepID=A0A5P9P6B0_9EURY|nr:hypothetical protein [Natronorubrum aibiense]QFU83721.1 hypothetical protein GCU68_14840 [Natronorubrum aibiense]